MALAQAYISGTVYSLLRYDPRWDFSSDKIYSVNLSSGSYIISSLFRLLLYSYSLLKTTMILFVLILIDLSDMTTPQERAKKVGLIGKRKKNKLHFYHIHLLFSFFISIYRFLHAQAPHLEYPLSSDQPLVLLWPHAGTILSHVYIFFYAANTYTCRKRHTYATLTYTIYFTRTLAHSHARRSTYTGTQLSHIRRRHRVPPFVGAALSFANLIAIWWLLPESLPPHKRDRNSIWSYLYVFNACVRCTLTRTGFILSLTYVVLMNYVCVSHVVVFRYICLYVRLCTSV